MTTSLDTILSGKGADAPVSEKRSQDSKPDASTTEVDGATDPVSTDGGGDVTTETGKTVPIDALHAERQKAKRYTEEVADLRRVNESLQRQVAEVLQRIPVPKAEPQEKTDFWSDPDPDARITGSVKSALDPIVRHIMQSSEAVSRRFAVSEHGQELVGSAYDAMEKRLASDPNARGDYQRIMQSGDPWGELVKWHRKETALAEIGTDPVAFREKMKAELLAELQNGNGQSGGSSAASAQVMPSNLAGARSVGARSGPAWAGPKSLTDIFKR